MVTPQNWLFLTTYKHLRKRLLSESQWDLVARLGEHAFESDAAAGAFVALVCITRQAPAPGHELHSTAGSDTGESSAKAMALRTGQLQSAFQSLQVSNPDSRVTVEVEPGLTRLSDFADSYLGLGTCDAEHYVRVYWEFPTLPKHWAFMQVADRTSARVGGFEHVVAWDSERRRVHGMTQEERRQGHNQDYRGSSAWGSAGVAIGLIRELRPSPYFGELFDKSLAVLIPKKPEYLPAIARYSTSRAFTSQVRRLDQKVMVTNSTLVKVPFDLAAEGVKHFV